MTKPTPPSEAASAIVEPATASDGTAARIAQLEADIDYLLQAQKDQLARTDRLIAENERLRAALRSELCDEEHCRGDEHTPWCRYEATVR